MISADLIWFRLVPAPDKDQGFRLSNKKERRRRNLITRCYFQKMTGWEYSFINFFLNLVLLLKKCIVDMYFLNQAVLNYGFPAMF